MRAVAKESIRALEIIEVCDILVWPPLMLYLRRLATSSPMSCHAKNRIIPKELIN